MLTKLRNARLINTSTRANLSTWSSSRENLGIWNHELEHRVEFLRFLKEIPANFQQLATAGNKREKIRDHMATFYRGKPKDHEVDAVVERITNLAAFLKDGRNAIEDKVGQSNFKGERWRNTERCEICGAPFHNLNEVSLDHIIPLSLGGADKKENWQLTCELCNQQKKEYWGIADISRIESFRWVQGQFLGLSTSRIIQQLTAKANPTRYWIFERDGRRCSHDQCTATAKTEKLYISRQEKFYLPTIDNLASFCGDCLPDPHAPYCD